MSNNFLPQRLPVSSADVVDLLADKLEGLSIENNYVVKASIESDSIVDLIMDDDSKFQVSVRRL